MEDHGQYQADRILVFDPHGAASRETWNLIERELHGTALRLAKSESEYQNLLKDQSFDVVILNCDLTRLNGSGLVHELRLCDHEPAIVVLASASDPSEVAKLYNSGCDRFIAQQDAWSDELGPAIRHLLRIRKLEEENMRIRAKLTEANRLLDEKNKRLDEFSMTVAHDIRGPVGGISMKLDYILDTYGDKIEGRFKELLSRALASSRRLTDIVQCMYEYAKLGSKTAQMQELPLARLVSEVVSDLSFDEALDIKIGIAEDLPAVWGNSMLLRRVFINLISNAVKYNDKREIIINIGLAQVDQKALGPFCEIFVSDNGPGIAAQDLQSIFAMFSRGSDLAAKNKDGLGIGLAVVQKIMELHYGNIQVESELNNGTTFRLQLPMQKIDLGWGEKNL